MASHSWMVLFHVLLLVFWLGTDLGVFLAAKYSEKSELSVETRGTLMQLAMVLDRLPRTAVILIIPSGLTLASNMQLLSLGGPLLTIAWVVALIWAAIMWNGFLKPHSPAEAFSHQANFVLHVVVVLALGYLAFTLWDHAPLWLTMKVVAITLVLVCGIALDIKFKPAVAAFVDIMTNGATPERDALYSKTMAPVYWWVIGIYLCVLMATFFGVVKPA